MLCPEILAEFPYQLDVFQRDAALAIEAGDHVLVTAHTSAGKSTVALYAIAKAIRENRRVVYTAPVKTLSNQKYGELRGKYGDEVGILTGDVKMNPDAAILVCTTEILRDKLFRMPSDASEMPSTASEMPSTASEMSSTASEMSSNAWADLAYVIFDEAHMINDPSRGHVWEECIMRMPAHVQMIMLSATMANPEEFAAWVEGIGRAEIGRAKAKKVPIVSTLQRPVPLKFHMFVPNPGTFEECLPWDEAMAAGHLCTIMDSEKGPFKSEAYAGMQKRFDYAMSREWEKKRRDMTTGRKGVAEANAARAGGIDKAKDGGGRFQMIGLLTPFVNFLHINQQLPALFFTLSRRRCDEYADRLQSCLIDHIERAEIERIFDYHIRKLPDAEQYTQVANVRRWLSKGVGVHHSGLLPLLKEIVEVVFTKGLVKAMFATETLAIGVNTPTRVVCFLDVSKPAGGGGSGCREMRALETAEYKQMAGRSGRRGLDVVGHVIYFPLREPVTGEEKRSMMLGQIKRITSKFNVSTHYVLRSVGALRRGSVENVGALTRGSLMHAEYLKQERGCRVQLENVEAQIERVKGLLNEENSEGLRTLAADVAAAPLAGGKGSKAAVAALKARVEALSKAERCAYDTIVKWKGEARALEERRATLLRESRDLPTLLHEDIVRVADFLCERGYLMRDEADGGLELTVKGVFANHINQCHEMLLTEPLFAKNVGSQKDPKTLCAWLATFIDDSACSAEALPVAPYTDLGKGDVEAGEVLFDAMNKAGIDAGEFTMSLRYVDPVWEWTEGAHVQTLCQTYGLFEGNLVRSLMRLVSLLDELKSAFESIQWIEWMVAVEAAKALVVRDVLMTESLYLNYNK